MEFLIIVLYMLPAILAMIRGHRSWVAIAALNVMLGWTLFFWIVALVWSLTWTGRN